MLDSLRFDVRLAWRGLRRANALAAAAILTLGLGITATIVMFALVHGVLLRTLPVRDQARVVVAWKQLRASGYAHYPFGGADVDTVARGSQLLEHAAGVTANGAGRHLVVENGEATYARVAVVTGAFFEVLATDPVIGRALTQRDDVDGAENVVVISEGLWLRRYGGSPNVLGRRIALDERPFTIVGVMPGDLDFPRGVELWRTTRSVPTSGPFGDAARREIDLIARMKPGVTVSQVEHDLAGLIRQLERTAPPNEPRGLLPVVSRFEDVVLADARSPLFALFAAVGLVLLIAVANVANLFLMRSEARRGEFAVRQALGAGRMWIVQQLVVESLLVTLFAAAAGLAAASWGLRGVLALMPDAMPRPDAVRIDASVVLFTVTLAFVTAVVIGLIPALSASRADLISRLRSNGAVPGAPAGANGRRALVIAQVALAMIVVTAAGLLARTVRNLQSVDLGLRPDHLVFVNLALPQAKYDEPVRHARFLDDLTEQMRAAPQIAAVTPVNLPPFTGEAGWDVPRFTAEGQSVDRAASNPALNLESVHPTYFETLQVPIVRGRAFVDADRVGAPNVAIVSEDVAARTWPGQDPVGRRLKLGPPDSADPWRTVVGVAAVTRYRELAQRRPTLYLPAPQFLMTAQMMVLRTSAPLESVARLSRELVRRVDRHVRVTRVASFRELLAGPLARPRLNAFLSSTFGVSALLLTAVGLYAVLAAYVRVRDREIGIRIALGASVAAVRRLVLRETLRLGGIGAAIGLTAATAATPLLRGMLYEIEPLDLWTTVATVLIVAGVCALSAYLPVRLATRLDPAVVLRRN